MKLYSVSFSDADGRSQEGLYLKFENALNGFNELVAYAGGRAREVVIEPDGECRRWDGEVTIYLMVVHTED